MRSYIIKHCIKNGTEIFRSKILTHDPTEEFVLALEASDIMTSIFVKQNFKLMATRKSSVQMCSCLFLNIFTINTTNI